MTWISLDEARPGMSVRRPIRNREGTILLAADAVLDERSLRILRSWGIEQIAIGPAAGDDEADAPDLAAAGVEEEAVDARFGDADDPVRTVLHQAILHHLRRGRGGHGTD